MEMKNKRTTGLYFLFLLLLSLPMRATGETPLFEGLGEHQYPISTSQPLAQKYFNQGLIFSYAFNHSEAERSFVEAQKIDPTCGMCYWGAALVLGPNINASMDPSLNKKALDYLARAKKHLHAITEKERDLLFALEKRYSVDPNLTRTELDDHYAKAMGILAEKYPHDADIASLYAEAMMDQHPWDFWTKKGEARPWTPTILKVLEHAMALYPRHPGAHHFYIHAQEASAHPEKALPSADILGSLVPGAGHLVHMPSHIYIRVGQYHKASLVNQKAIAADNRYIEQARRSGMYVIAYRPHNYHFLLAAATLEGRSALALQTSKDLVKILDPHSMHTHGFIMLQHFFVYPLFTQVRFGKWDEILKAERPQEDLPYVRAIWHYTRAIGFARKKLFLDSEKEIAALKEFIQHPLLAEERFWEINKVYHVLSIALDVARGELELEKGRLPKAIQYLERAKEREDSLRYIEPDDWHHPVRQILGVAYLKSHKYELAEKVYREDLAKFPRNGWSLFGLMKTYQRQGKTKLAVETREKFKKAWKFADINLSQSRF